MIHPPTQMLELSNGRETIPANDLVATASIDLLSNIQELAEQISHDEIGDAVGSLSLSRGDILAGFKDTRSRAESNETVHNSPSGSPGLSPDLKSLATPKTATEIRYHSEPMTRQPSEASSVSTLQAGGSEDEITPIASLKAPLNQQQKVFATRALELPTDRRRPAEFSSAGAEFRFLLDTPLKQQLSNLGQDSGSRLATVILVAWSILLYRLSGEDSFVVGMGQVDELNLSAKALPVNVDLSGEPNTLQLLERVKHAFAVAAVHSSAKVDGTTAPTEEKEGPPFQVALYSHNGGFAQPPPAHVSVKCDLELHLLQDKEDAAVSIRYASALYNEETVERYAGYLKAILANMVANGGQSIETFDITTPAEKSLVLEAWNQSATEFPADRCIHQLFEQQVKRSPDAIAIVHGEQTLTYHELNAVADRLACQLVEAGVHRGDLVAFLLYKSVELVATQLAVLKVGAAYVPIDPKAPVERQAFIAKDSAAILLVTDTTTDVPSQLRLPLLRFDVTALSPLEMKGSYPEAAASSLDTAYVMYTSGSTGVPKGVMVPHRGIARLVINNGFADIGPEDRVAFATNPSFDPSTFDVWAALVNGARMIVIDNDTYLDAHRLAEALEYHRVTSLILTMALFHQYAFIIGSALSKLKYLICGGEQALVEAFAEVLQHGGPVRLLNVYGPTEATVIATTYEATSAISQVDRMPIGRPMSNTQAYVLDKHHNPVPLGVVGELYIGGPGVANGYLNRPDLTAERFIADPFSKAPDARMYKSGDLVRYLPDGNLVFMGRNDDQVKVRGFRIELGEIEERLAEHAQVREVIVLATGEGSGNKRLVAYVVAAPAENLALTLQKHLAASLPEYMVPSAFVRMDVFPLTNNGKVDRRALPEPEENSFVRQVYEAPVGEMEEVIANIWSELLAVNQISRHDSFFALGGHSLMAIKMLDRLHRLGLTISIKTLFESPCLSVLAEALSKHLVFTVPSNLITPETTRLTPELLPLIELTQGDIDRIVDNVPGGISNIQDIYSLAPLQDGILFHHLLGTEGDPYVLISHLAFQDRALLNTYLSAFQKAVDRHDILRTAFIWEGLSTPAQVVYRHAPLSITELTLDPADGPIQEQLKQRYNHSNYRPDLTQAPLLRFAITKGDDGRWILVQTLHHLISDHVSIEKMNAEVEKILQGESDALSTPSQFRDFIAQVRAGPTQDEHEVFFKEILSDIEEPTLPFGLNEIHNNGDEVNEAHMILPQPMNDRLRAQAKKLGVSVAALCHAAWAQVLAQTSGQDRVVFGTVLVGGLLGEQSDQAGMGITINTLPFRCDMDERGVRDCVYQIHSRLAALVEHENASLALAQRCSSVPAGMPLFSALLNFRHTLMPTSDADDIEFTSREERVNHEGIEFLGAQERTNYPFTLSVEDFGSALGLTAQILQPVDPKAVCGYMEQALNSLVVALEDSPDMPVSQLDVLPTEERTKLLHVWNATDNPYPEHLLVHQIFEQQVKQSPSAIAVEHGELALCYGELDSKANRLARQLTLRGVNTGDHVATYMPRSFELIIAQLAILKAGAVYVPIDIKAPLERQAYIASDSGSKLLITDASTNVDPRIQVPVLRLGANQEATDNVQDVAASSMAISSSSDATAYVMYTSGSTGLPKGVMVPHCGIARLAINSGYAEIGPDDRIAFVANPAFDASTFDVWTALLNGARLIILDNDNYLDAHRLAESLDRYKVTAILLTSALFHQYAFIIGPALSKLKYLVCGGEQGLIEAFSEVLRHGGPVRLINAYGPTENTVIATTYEGTSAVSLLDRLPIGRPMSNTRVYVLDKNRNPVPMGAVGELYISGAGVANGYLNRPDLTAERFLVDPFSNVPGARMYKSGDLVRYLPDGNLVFMGRNDDQVKIRGFRIELGEIEERLSEHPQVREVAVLAIGESSSDKRLVAYVVSPPHDNLVQTLRDHLATTLPEYMIPSAFVRLDALPLTNNGKVDRRALPKPDSSSYVTQEYVAPQGEIEIALAAMWCDLLKIDRVGRHDSFFVLGGHSLLAVRLMNRVSTLGVQLPLSTMFSSPTLSALAEVVGNKLSQEQSVNNNIASIPRKGALEVSLAQQRLWFLAQMEGVSENYHVPVALRLRGKLNQGALELALNTLFARHEALRTVFVSVNGQPTVQLLSTDEGVPFVLHNLQEVLDKETMVKQFAALGAIAPFDMEKGPLVRAQLIQLAEDEHVFLLTQHHIITDGWSLGVMFRELNEIYAAHCADAPNPLVPLSIQYPDYAAWQREWLTGDRLKEQAAYWRETLAGAPVSIELPTDRPRPPRQSHAGAAIPIRLDAQLTRSLQILSRRNGVTLFMTVLTAWSAVLARLSGQEDLVIGTPTANRNHPQVEQMIGFFVNTLALRLDVSGDPSAEQLLERVRKTTIAAQANQDLSFEQVVEIAQPPRRMDQTPLFQVLFAWQNNDVSALRLQDVEATVEETQYATIKFDLELDMAEVNDELCGSLRYSTALYERNTIDRHVGYLEAMLQWMTIDLQHSISKAPILGSAEQELLLQTWNNVNVPYPSDQCVHRLFEDQVERTPGAIAIVHDDRSLTYHSLNRRANRLALKLIELGAQPGDNIAILLERSFELIIAQIAILKVGAAYVPIDVKAPLERQSYIASNSGSILLITTENMEVPVQIQTPLLRLSADQNDNEDVRDVLNSSLHTSTSSDATANVMYTSGSTGLPKGVMVTHRGIARLSINNGFADFDGSDRVAFSSNPSFDPSTFEVWASLLTGAQIVIIDSDIFLNPHLLAAELVRHQVTFLHMTNALLHQYAFIIGETLSKLKYLTGAAEQGSIKAYSAVLSHGGPVRLLNRYGPTEATVDATAYVATSAITQLDRLPIGRPTNNTPVYVLDKHRKPVPIGVVGELYIGGPGVASGYLGRPDLTAERFVPDPFSSIQGARMYRAGDLVRYLPDGNIVFLGRNDDQVKVRGYRIELGEIQVRLAEHPQVREVAVLVTGERTEDKRLVAYVVSAPDENLIQSLRDHLAATLPEYMIPSAFVRLDALPLTNNGKIDRRALPEPDSSSFVTREYVAPQGDLEIALAAMWSEVLKIENVGRHDNFFMLGGHSLLAVRLMNRVSTLGVQLPLSTMFSSPTLSALAEVVSSKISAEVLPQSTITTISRDGPLEVSFAQQRLWFLAQMEGVSDIYHVPVALRLQGNLNQGALQMALNSLFARHEALRTVFVSVNGQPKVRLLPAENGLPFILQNLRGVQDKETMVKQLAAQEATAPFDMEKGPLVRAQLIQLAEDEHVFLLTQHHIITDGWSLGVMFRELNELYAAHCADTPSTLALFSIQYPDYAAWQREWLTGDRLKEQASYWRETLAGAPVSIELPTDRPRPPRQSHAGAAVPIRLDAQLTRSLKILSQKNGVTLFMTVLAAWSAVLARLSCQEDLVIGTPTANRNHPQVEQMIGFFVNTLALRLDVSGDPSAEQLLERVRKTTIAAQANQDLSFEQVVEIAQPPRRADQTPLFQVLFAWQNNDVGTLHLQDVKATVEETEFDIVKFDQELILFEENDEITGILLYATALFDRETIDRHVGYLEAMLRWMTIDTERSIGEAPILGSAEKELLLQTWNNTDRDYPSTTCIHRLFEAQVALSPDVVAVVHDNSTMTYRELKSRANGIARQLVATGVQPGDLVLLLLNRSINLVAAEIAILKVGAAYVPIDIKAPLDRQAYIASDSGAKLLISDENTVVPAQIQVPLLRLSTLQENYDGVEDTFDSSLHSSSSDATAYVMYTSGSTGTPKGVMVPHRGIARLVINNGFSDMGPGDRMAFGTNPSFDPSTFEVWAPLLNGACIVVVDNDDYLDAHRLATALVRHQITCLYMTNALLNQYAFIIGDTLAGLKYLFCGAQQGLIKSYSAVLEHGGPVRLVNRYGPTEITVNAATYTATSAINQMDRLPIGRPIGNTRLYVLDKHQNPVPVGVIGELFIGGPGVANGYYNRPDLTVERFLADPFSEVQGARMYRSGDLVRYMPDGNLVFMARNDDQVKIRGYRIELGEIEVRLVEHAQVREAAVLVISESNGDTRLAAYVVADPQEKLAHALREHLGASLPEYMIPSAFVRLDSFPLTSNGKIDRRALPAPDASSFVGREYEEPQGKVEKLLADVWASLLRIDNIGRHDNFFMLGGHSLLAVRMIEQLRQLGFTLSVSALFDNPVLHTLAASLRLHVAGPEVPPNLITNTTEALTPELLPLIDLTQADIDVIVSQVPGGVANIQDIYALSPLQDGILFHHMMAAEGDPYLLMVCTAFRDRELLDRYLSAFQQVVDRHDILRTAVFWDSLTTPAQVVLRQASLSITEHSLEPADGPVVDQLMKLYDARKHRIDLSSAPLTRFVIAQDVDGRWIMLQLLHHLIGDHSTLEVTQEEIEAILQGQVNSLPAPQPYRNLIAQARMGASVEEHEEFFHKMLQDIDTPSLPYGLSDIHREGGNVSELHMMLPRDLNDTLRGHAKRLGVSLASLCHLAWAQVIAATSGQEKVVFGTVLFGRMQGGSGSDRAMGLFINTLPFRVDVGAASTLETVRRVQTDMAALLEHEHASLALAQRCSSVPSGVPLFNALLNYRHSTIPVEAASKDTGIEPVEGLERTNYAFVLSVEDLGSALGLTAQVVQPYEPSTICGYMQQALQTLAEALENAPEMPVHGLTILPAEEYEMVVHSWNRTETSFPSDRPVHQLFEDQAIKTPDAIAVVHDDLSMTYRALNGRAVRLARKLIDLGVQHGDNVAILLERSFNLIITQLAILKVGATYVPIDIKAPVDRQLYILSDSRANLLITEENMEVNVQLQVPLLRLGVVQDDIDEIEDVVGSLPIQAASSLDTAYIMYTSGSTGLPKGVMTPHRGVARLAINNGYASVGSDDRIAFASNPAFDASTFDVWAPLLNGGRVVIVDADTFTTPHLLAKTLDRHQVTGLFMTTALFNQYVHSIGTSLAKLRYLLCGGEQENLESFSTLMKHGGPEHLIHCYGPTETTTFATTYEVKQIGAHIDRLPIGRPISNTQSYVLDEHRKPVPLGAVGELYLGGVGVANGYLNRPDLTAERFLPDPFSKTEGARMYKSGDLVRYLPDGNLVFVSRNDGQVKIRGFRIELGEIQARLEEHELVKEAVIITLGDGGDKRLIAYVVASVQEQLARTLREYLTEHLPEYMVPAAFVRMDMLPVTNNGKIDRRALPKPDSTAFVTQGYVAPEGDVEITLADIWVDLLKIERVGRQDNFFMLGGHSLLAVQMIGRLHRLGLSLSVRTLFDNPVLSVLAASLSQHHESPEAPANLITQETTKITPDMLPLIDLSQDDIDHIISLVPGGVANIQDIYGLSPLQDGILFHHMMATQGDPYLLVGCVAFDNRALVDRYLTAFQKIVDRHDILRTAIMWENIGSPAQVVLRQAALSITEHSLDPADGPIIDQLRQRYDARKHRIDLNSAPLCRFVMAEDTDGRWIVLQLLHHIVGDHSTMDVVEEEIEAILNGRADSLPAPQPYRNLIAQARMGVSAEEHAAFFRKMLHDVGTPSLPFGLSDLHGEGGNITQSRTMLSQDLNDKLRGYAKRLGVSVASLCHLAWAQVIAATSGQKQVVFGTVLFGRMQGGSGSDRAMGLFINTLPLRVDVEDVSVLDSVRRVQTDLASLLEHEHASLALAQRCSSVPSGTPLFSAILNYRHNAAPAKEARADTGMEVIGGNERDNFPLGLSVEDFGTALGLTTQVVEPYDPSRICGYMEQALQNLADALEHAPEDPLQSLSVLPTEEHELIVHSWNKTGFPYPNDRCVHQLFEDQVGKTPYAVAVVHEERSMTYYTLNNRAASLAHRLVELGVRHGDHVAILLERSFELIIAQLAILKAGAAYVPIDIKAPVDRQDYIVSDSGAKLLITDEITEVPVQIQVPLLRLSVDQENTEEEQGLTSGSQLSSVSSLDTAYVMYTSGSTGLPKGVLVPHRAIAGLLINHRYKELGPNDRIAFVNNPAFDASTADVWGPLLHGSRIVIIDNDTYLDPHRLADALDRYQITSLEPTSALFHQYAFVIGPALSKLRYLVSGGEQGLIEAYTEILRHGGPVRLLNTYGPTETTVIATAYEATLELNQLDRVPIGRPICNARLYVLDQHRNPVPLGVTGELYIGGPGVANGYHNRPDLTAERFLPDPYSPVQGARMYKSGDLVRYLPDGNLVFMCRNDDQIKIRGYRIELGEIEMRLAEHPQVREVVVLAVGDNSSDKRLVAYVVSTPQEDLVQTLRDHLSATLPEYMVPSAFVRLDAMPVTNNGKIDRRALPQPDSASFVTQGFVAPQGDLEIAMAAIWGEILKIERVGRHDNFFMLGGHSLLAVRMIGTVRSRLGIELKLQSLFTAPTIAELTQKLSQGAGGQADEYGVLLPLRTQGSRPPLFCIHSGLGLSWLYMGLAQHLHPDQPLYGLQARGLDGTTPMAGSIEEMASDYIQQIRKVQPQGPYHLLGWCIGGNIAHCMASELERQGEQVPLLAIMDSLGDYSVLAQNDIVIDSIEDQDEGVFIEHLARYGENDSMEEGSALWEKAMPISSNNLDLVKVFTPSVYSGGILYFKATVQQDEHSVAIDPNSWRPFTLGEIDVHDIECTHMEMDKPEHIGFVGRTVASRIEELM